MKLLANFMLTSLTLMFASKISLVTYLTYLLVHVSRVNGNLELWFLLRGDPEKNCGCKGEDIVTNSTCM